MFRFHLRCAVLFSTLLATAACSHVPVGFQGMQIKSVQLDPSTTSLKLDLVLLFQVRSVEDIPLLIPSHRYAITLGGVKVDGTSPIESFVVKKGETRPLPYPFSIDLSGAELDALRGKEVPFQFKVDLPVSVAGVGQAVETASDGAASGLGHAAAQAASVLPAELRQGTLTLSHEGSIRLPKFPEVRPPGTTSLRLELIPASSSTPASAAQTLARLRSTRDQVQTLTDTFERTVGAMNTAVQAPPTSVWPPKVRLGDALRAAGAQSAKIAFDAMCNADCTGHHDFPVPEGTIGLHYIDDWHNQCQQNSHGLCKRSTVCPPPFSRHQTSDRPTRCEMDMGYDALLAAAGDALHVPASDESLIPAPKLPALDTLVNVLPVGSDWNLLRTALRSLLDLLDPLSELADLFSVPDGLRVVLPFTLVNPNEFPLPAPVFQVNTRADGRNTPLTHVALSITPKAPCPDDVRQCLPAKGEAAAELALELRWSELGGIVELLKRKGTVPKPRIEGRLAVDLGFGQVALPLDVAP